MNTGTQVTFNESDVVRIHLRWQWQAPLVAFILGLCVGYALWGMR